MPSLDDQLRAYGRRIHHDLAPDAEQQNEPNPGVSGSGAPRWSPRSSWFLLVAAATTALVITSALLPVRPQADTTNRKASGLTLGVCLLVGGCSAGGDGEESSSTSAAAATTFTSSAAPLFFDSDSSAIEPGTYVVDRLGTPIQVTIPAGWTRYQDFAVTGPNDSFLAFFDIIAVSGDACEWRTNGPREIGETVDDLVAALQAQVNTVVTTPEPVEIGGFSGKQLAVDEPPNFTVADCDEGSRMGWKDKSNNIVPLVDAEGLNALIALDLNGQRGVITYGAYEPMTAETKAQIDAMVASLKIG